MHWPRRLRSLDTPWSIGAPHRQASAQHKLQGLLFKEQKEAAAGLCQDIDGHVQKV